MKTNEPKSIALVANSSWYIYNLRLGLIRALKEASFSVTVLAPKDDFSERFIEEGCRYIEIEINSMGTDPVEDFVYCYNLMRIYRKHRFYYVFHYTIKPNIYGPVAAAVHGIPSTSIISGLGYSFINKGVFNFFIKMLYKIATYLADEVWFVNPDDKKLFEAHNIVSTCKAKLLPGEGVNTLHFSPQKDRISATKANHFIFCGRLIWTKGVGEFIEAARLIKAQHPEATFSILGFLHVNNPDAIPAEVIEAWQKEGVAQYLGATDDVRPFLEAASCLVLPSYYGEGTPRSLLEASSMKVPVITTDQVGCREVVRDGYNGFLCNKKDVADLAQKMDRFVRMPFDERLRLGENGRRLVEEKFDEAFVIQHYLDKTSKAGTTRRSTEKGRKLLAAALAFTKPRP